MPLYAYVALGENVASLSGASVAASEQALRSELSGRGLLIQKVHVRNAAWGLRARRIYAEDFALFNQEFMALSRAGLTVPDALALARERPDCPALGRILVRVHEDVRGGMAFSE